jgi:hypothetical protein
MSMIDVLQAPSAAPTAAPEKRYEEDQPEEHAPNQLSLVRLPWPPKTLIGRRRPMAISLQGGCQPHQIVEDPLSRWAAQPLFQHHLPTVGSVVVFNGSHGGRERGSVDEDG